MLESADAGDEKAITAMGLLNTMETILAVMEEKPEVHQALEPVILQVEFVNSVEELTNVTNWLSLSNGFLSQAIHHIFTNSIMEFYEEAMSLSCDLTTKHVSPDMWKMLEVVYIFSAFQIRFSNAMPHFL